MWNLEGMQVWGDYMGDIPVEGTVSNSRVKYGGEVVHTVILKRGFETPYKVFRDAGEVVLLEHKYVTRVKD